MKNKLLFFGCMLLCVVGFSQPFGNEWINFSQPYYKIKVAEDGVYRIDASVLQQAGITGISPSRIQLFRKGVEVPLHKVIGPTGYLEFYGQKNDGKSDTPLYVDPSDQPHTYYNLFSDTASYFLTISQTATGKSIGTSNLGDNSGLVPESYHLNELLNLQTAAYSTGVKFGSNAELSSGQYEEGEGWTGTFFTRNQNRTFTFNLSGYVESGPVPNLEIRLIGGNSLAHNIEISAGPATNNLRVIDNVNFSGWTQTLTLNDLAWSDIAADGTCVVRVTALGVLGQADRVSVAYLKITYPQALDLGDTENKVFYQRTSSEARSWLVIPTTNATATRVIEITDPYNTRFISPSATSTSEMELLVNDPTIPRQFYAFTSIKSVASIQEVSMSRINPVNTTYLLLTSKHFHSAASDGLDPVAAYESYRESSAGGNHQVTSSTIDEVFDQYGFGDPTPLAIRNFVAHSLSLGAPQHLFIIGKGLSTNQGFYRKDPATTPLINHVPAFGFPGSDVLYTVNVAGNPYAPAFGAGRINAYTPEDVKNYLDKVKTMEALPYNALWRKNQLFLSGGQNAFEQQAFSNYVENFRRLAENHYLGGRGQIRRKITTDPTEPIDIKTEINNGQGMVTLFGHSSSQNSDIEIGNVNDHNNTGKYPVFLVNGCNAGEIFGTTVTFGEHWVNADDLGAIAFIAHADFSQSINLKRFSELFFQEAFNNEATFGSTLGQITTAVGSRYFDLYGVAPSSLSQVQLMTLLGDPALTLFGAVRPDYEPVQEQITAESLTGDRILASQGSFHLNFIINNYGKTQTDSIEIEITRTLPEGGVAVQSEMVKTVLYRDTIQVMIENDPAVKVDGNNTFQLRIDPQNLIPELNENNNSATFELFIPRGNTIHLFPTNQGIQQQKEVVFTWQAAQFIDNPRDFTLQYDSVPDFSSLLSTTQIINGGYLLRHNADLNALPDSTTLYWRTRYTNPLAQEDTSWVSSSFTLIGSTTSGWGQVDAGQFEDNILSGIALDESTGQWSFEEKTTDFQIVTYGINNPSEYEDLQVVVGNVNYLITENTFDPVCRLNSINAVFIDRTTGQPYRPIQFSVGDVTNPLICGRVPQVIHNLVQNDVLGPNRYLDSLIGLMKPNDYVLLFNFDSVAFSNWDTQLHNSLGLVGIETSTLTSLTDGQPAIFLGKKGSPLGDATELVNDGTAVPVKEQFLTLAGEVNSTLNSGTITTRRIGPAKTWNNLSYEVLEENNEQFNIDVVGITPNGAENTLFTDARIGALDISSINALTYPYLKLNISLVDNINLTPPQLKSLLIDYDLPPEGILIPTTTSTATVQEGEPFSISYLFVNISKEDFQDSLGVSSNLLTVATSNNDQQLFNIGPPATNDTTAFSIEYATRNKVGQNNLAIRVTPVENELLAVNNFFNFPSAVTVNADDSNPVLDVTFDGDYLLNGDIVSPNPRILVRLKDENQFLFKEDTTGIHLSLKLPCETCQFERVNFTDPRLTYTTASEGQDFEITYLPGPLDNGMHAFRVAGEDESGNSSGENDFEVNFEVINESSITHFYPYPNPFSTSTRFVFTLTGSEIPDQLKIQIMTISGRVIREITQEEIGPIKIGNNITEYAWDGRDEFGDLLANGVYLYRVFIQSSGESLQHRFTSADSAFKHGYGKIYILR